MDNQMTVELDVVVVCSTTGADAEDARFALRELQRCWSPRTRVLVGMTWQAALALLPDDVQGHVLVLDGTWLSLEKRCLARLQWGLSQGADVALACDSGNPAPMLPVSYATLRGMERYVDLHEVQAMPAEVHEGAKAGLGLVAGWRRRLAGEAAVVRVAGAWVHDASGFFASAREEVLPMVPTGLGSILDVGGGEGGFLVAVKAREPQARTQLVELTEVAASVARTRAGVDAVWVGDFADWQPVDRYDCISFLDVLEHMHDPERALRHARGLLAADGCVVMSIPNVGHWSVVADLLEGRWDWAPAGIHCYTHVRFFTRQTVEDMLHRVGLEVQAWMPTKVPCQPQWLAQWQTPGLCVDTDALDVYAYVVRAVARAR